MLELGAFLEPAYSLFAIGTFLVFWPLYFLYFYLNLYATSIIGLSAIEAVYLIVIVSAVGIPVRPLLGIAADKYLGPLPTLVFSAVALGAMLYTWIAVHSSLGLYFWVVVYGAATAAAQGIFVGALASLTSDLSKLGTRAGMIFSILSFATLAGPPTAGALIQHEGGTFTGAQVWGGTATIAGALFVGVARWSQVKYQ